MTHRKLTIRKLTREDFFNFKPAPKHVEMHNMAKSNELFINLILSGDNGAYALVDENDYVFMMMGGQVISHCTAEVWLAFGEGFEPYVKSCIKALRVLIHEKMPNYVYRLEANVYIDDYKAINLLEKCLGFSIIGVRRKLGAKGEDIVLLERLL